MRDTGDTGETFYREGLTILPLGADASAYVSDQCEHCDTHVFMPRSASNTYAVAVCSACAHMVRHCIGHASITLASGARA